MVDGGSGTEVIVVGCQAGDEGKGKFVDLLCGGADVVVRFQGGPHTGHTVVTSAGRFAFVQVPAGVLQARTGLLGYGCVVEPATLVAELADIRERAPQADLHIAETCHVVMPYHQLQDQALEQYRGDFVATSTSSGFATGSGRIGSTGRGVGPCREDKIARLGVRLVDLLDPPVLRARLAKLLPLKAALLERVFGMPLDAHRRYFDIEEMTATYSEYGSQLADRLVDASRFLADARGRGGAIVYEGAQSMGLDLEHGTYPYCSSGHSAAGGAAVGTGSPPTVPVTVVGVSKAYMARVGGGPLPTELSGEVADRLVARGREAGTVTGRRRRVGWLDLAFLRKAVRIDGVSRLCFTNVDVLAGLPEVLVSTHYLIDGRPVDEYPVRLSRAARVEPVYEQLPGWPDQDWTTVAEGGYAALPAAVRRYVEWVVDRVGTSLGAVSFGPRRDQTVIVDLPRF